MKKSSQITQELFVFVQKIPFGKVSTYKKLGQMIGISPRYVGKLLHLNDNSNMTPCHRVVKSNMSLATGYKWGGFLGQKHKLSSEGIIFTKHNKIREGQEYLF